MTRNAHQLLCLGVLTGIEGEARILRNKLPDQETLRSRILLSAARSAGARRAAAEFKAAGCTHLLSWGLAGGLDPALTPGTLLLPRSIIAPNGLIIPVSTGWHEAARSLLPSPATSTTPILGVDDPIVSNADKATLYARHPSVPVAAVDMESHVLGKLAKDAGLEFLVIRAVADTAHMALPHAAQTSVTPEGRISLSAVLASLLAHPAQLPELIRLGRAAGKAMDVLLSCADMGASVGFGMLSRTGDTL